MIAQALKPSWRVKRRLNACFGVDENIAASFVAVIRANGVEYGIERISMTKIVLSVTQQGPASATQVRFAHERSSTTKSVSSEALKDRLQPRRYGYEMRVAHERSQRLRSARAKAFTSVPERSRTRTLRRRTHRYRDPFVIVIVILGFGRGRKRRARNLTYPLESQELGTFFHFVTDAASALTCSDRVGPPPQALQRQKCFKSGAIAFSRLNAKVPAQRVRKFCQ